MGRSATAIVRVAPLLPGEGYGIWYEMYAPYYSMDVIKCKDIVFNTILRKIRNLAPARAHRDAGLLIKVIF